MKSQFILFCAVLLSSCAERNHDAPPPTPAYIEPESRLEQLLVRSSQNQALRETFAREFLRSVVFLRVDDATAMDAQQGKLGQVRFFKVRMKDGVDAMALYTSERRLREAAGPRPAIPITGRQALMLGRGLSISLNYGLVPAAIWEPQDAEALLRLK